MATMVGMSDNFKTLLTGLIELEYDAMEAYKASIERLDTPVYRDKLVDFLNDHHQHMADLNTLANQCGIEAPTGPDAKQILTKGKVVMANMVGDKAILMAMKTNEDDTVTAYERACAHKELPAEARPIMERGLADERRHRAWMIEASKSDKQAAA